VLVHGGTSVERAGMIEGDCWHCVSVYVCVCECDGYEGCVVVWWYMGEGCE